MTHSFPTRRTSDLQRPCPQGGDGDGHHPFHGRGGILRPGGDALLRPADRARYAGRPQTQRGKRSPSGPRSDEHTSELQSLMRLSYAVSCLTTKNTHTNSSFFLILHPAETDR